MARPIKETPVLKGAEAVRFMKIIESGEDKTVSQDEKDRLKKNFKIFQSRFRF